MAMKKFFVGVKGVIIKDDKVLIVKSAGADWWELPGGRIEDDETIQQALERELHEELPNIQNIQVGDLLNAYRVQKNAADDISLVLLYYKVSAEFIGDPQLSFEHDDWRWVDQATALTTVAEGYRQAIRRAFETEE